MNGFLARAFRRERGYIGSYYVAALMKSGATNRTPTSYPDLGATNTEKHGFTRSNTEGFRSVLYSVEMQVY